MAASWPQQDYPSYGGPFGQSSDGYPYQSAETMVDLMQHERTEANEAQGQRLGMGFSAISQSVLASGELLKGQRFSAKIPPEFDGSQTYFQYRDDIMDWLYITSVAAPQRAPLMKTRFSGPARLWNKLLEPHMKLSLIHI